ncbi:MAG: PAS domain S-box protein, partial [Acidobacteriota bacterium]|nr:PAS domain S-box protein [Acidobacteriota bacterium]
MEPEQKLQDQFGDAPYRMLIKENDGFAIFHIDPAGHIVSWNAGAERIFGYREAEVTGQPFALIFTPEDRRDGAPEQELKGAASAGFVNDVRWHLRQDNTRFYANGVTTALRDEAGVLRGYAKVARDDTARKLAEDERDRFFTISLDMLCIAGLDGYIKRANPAFEKTLGYTQEELLATPFLDLVHPEDRAVTIKEMEKLLAGTSTINFENRYRCRNGSYKWLAWTSAPFVDEETVYAVARDITEQKHADEVLGQSYQRTTNILESITDAFFTIDHEWRFTYLNQRAELLLRRARQELLGRSIWEEFPEAVGSTFYEQYHKAAAEQAAVTFEGFYPPLDKWFDVHAYPSADGLSVYFHDISKRKLDQEALSERARLAMMDADVGLALVQGDSLRDMLRRCAEVIVRHLDAAFARIWTLNKEDNVLELQVSAGMYTHTDGSHGRVPVGKFKIGRIAQERQPHLTNGVIGDPRVSDQEWAKREGMVAFAGYPVIVEDQLIGVVAMFARKPLTEATLQAMAS